MNSINQDLARAVIEARLASARERQLADQVTKATSVARRAERGRISGGWLGPRLRRRAGQSDLRRAGANRVSRLRSRRMGLARPLRRRRLTANVRTLGHGRERQMATELESILGGIAERIAVYGTVTESRVLRAMSDVSGDACPGAAAALVDWTGSEIARLRAFGIVHGVVLHVLGPCDHARLLDEVFGSADRAAG